MGQIKKVSVLSVPVVSLNINQSSVENMMDADSLGIRFPDIGTLTLKDKMIYVN